MKRIFTQRNFISILFTWIVLSISTLASSSLNISINGILYTPVHSPLTNENGLFLSLEDLSNITFSSFSEESNGNYSWTFNDTNCKITVGSKILTSQSKTEYLNSAPIIVDDVLYLPITILKNTQTPYILDKKNTQLEIGISMPYSRYKDSYSSHSLLETEFKSLNEVFSPLISNSTELINNACKYNQYIGFASSSYKKPILDGFSKIIDDSMQMEVVFRNFNSLSYPHSVSTSNVVPMEVSLDNDEIKLSLGEATEIIDCIFTVYNPNQKTPSIDINKSFDMTIMRKLYENFRNANDLKDDASFSPITTIQTGLCDSISYNVYSDHFVTHTPNYVVTIYKQVLKDKIRYIIDMGSPLPPINSN